MPNGACYGTCRMVLGMDEVDVIFDKEHELFILQIVSDNIAHVCYQHETFGIFFIAKIF